MALPFPILTAEEAAEMIQNGDNIGFSGFTAAGAAKCEKAANKAVNPSGGSGGF